MPRSARVEFIFAIAPSMWSDATCQRDIAGDQPMCQSALPFSGQLIGLS